MYMDGLIRNGNYNYNVKCKGFPTVVDMHLMACLNLNYSQT